MFRFMHRECFEVWQEGILAYIGKLEGGKRSKHWSDKQRVSVVAAVFSLDILLQIDALWKPSGYHMAVESCLCRCSEVSGRGGGFLNGMAEGGGWLNGSG